MSIICIIHMECHVNGRLTHVLSVLAVYIMNCSMVHGIIIYNVQYVHLSIGYFLPEIKAP